MKQVANAIAKTASAIPPGSIPAPWVSAFDAVLSALESRGKGNADVEAVVKAVRQIIPAKQKKESINAPQHPAP